MINHQLHINSKGKAGNTQPFMVWTKTSCTILRPNVITTMGTITQDSNGQFTPRGFRVKGDGHMSALVKDLR